MKSSKILYHCFIMFLTVFAIAGCRSDSASRAKKTGVIKEFADNISTEDLMDNSMLTASDTDTGTAINIPSPYEILGEILSTPVEYNVDIANPLKNERRYVNTKCQAFNLGIYFTDFAYLNLNSDKSKALQYFKTIRNLSQKLNIYLPLSGKSYDRIQKNILIQDSLDAIFSEMYFNTLDLLESSKQNDIYALIVTGALVESLYIPTISIENMPENKIVLTKIFEEKYIFNNFYEHVSKYKKDENISEILVLLENTKKIMNQARSKSSKMVISKKGKGDFTISGGDDIIVTTQMFRQMSDHVKKVRKEIVKSI